MCAMLSLEHTPTCCVWAAGDQNYCLEVGALCWNALLCDIETPGLGPLTCLEGDGFGDPLHPCVVGRSMLGKRARSLL
jgi:hypothetical protein